MRKARKILQRRSTTSGIAEDANQHLWAISYSDLIMVLMCFFIVFFRFTDNVEVRPIDKIVMALNDAKPGTDVGAGAGEGAGSDQQATKVVLAAKLLNQIRGIDLKEAVTSEGDVLILDFPPEAYGPGGFKVEERVKRDLDKVLKILGPFRDQVRITFIGHADDTPIAVVRHNVVDSNLVLSNLRGAKAMEHAIHLGYDPSRLTAGGAGEYTRNTRSLTVRILADSAEAKK